MFVVPLFVSTLEICLVQVFRKVLAEVESRIAQLRELLHHRLEEAPTSLEAQKKLIRSDTDKNVTVLVNENVFSPLTN